MSNWQGNVLQDLPKNLDSKLVSPANAVAGIRLQMVEARNHSKEGCSVMTYTKADIIRLKEKEVSLQKAMMLLAVMNVPSDPGEAVESQARFQFARDLAAKAGEEYERAFAEWYRSGCPETPPIDNPSKSAP